MADYAPNYTARYRIRYRTLGQVHTAQFRLSRANANPAVAGAAAFSDVLTALCVPLMLGDAPAAFLYLDARGTVPVPMRAGATEFCVALSRIASLALAVVTTMFVGLVPAWNASRQDLANGMKESGKGAGASSKHGWIRNGDQRPERHGQHHRTRRDRRAR